MSKAIEIALLVVLLFITSAAVSLLTAYPVMLLWNWLLPSIFDGPTINFWEALGITLLCSLLFKPASSSKKGKE